MNSMEWDFSKNSNNGNGEVVKIDGQEIAKSNNFHYSGSIVHMHSQIGDE